MVKYIDRYRLSIFGLPEVDSLEDLANYTHLSKGLIYRLSEYSEKYYYVYELPKKNGGHRLICQPSFELKALQAWILRKILDKLTVTSSCKGFERGTSILENVNPHIGAKAILCLDIDDFFPSIKSSQVWYIFNTAGYSPKMAYLLTNICTFNKVLPQGAPTSPKLANLACWRLDKRLSGYVGKRGITYTRYADDLSFSSTSIPMISKAYKFIRYIIEDEGYQLNEKKVRFMGPSRQHKITGLILNQSGVGIGRNRYREIRSEIHKLCFISDDDSRVYQINGWLSYIRYVDSARYEILKKYIIKLRKKHPSGAIKSLSLK